MPRARPPHKPAVDRLKRALRAGQSLVLTQCGCGPRFSLEPSGRPVPTVLAKLLLRRRSIVPAGDGLFAGSPPQTWRAR